jgi:lipopolysaccharide export system protein LptA
MSRFLTTLGLLALLPVFAMAQDTQVSVGGLKQDPSAPVEVTADALQVNQNEGTALYTGNVVVVQGDLRLAAPSVLVVYSEEASRLERLEATGGVTLVGPEEAAEAQRADYDFDTGTVVLTGDVLLTQGNSALTSESMIVNLDDGTARMTGRVRSVLQPSGGN